MEKLQDRRVPCSARTPRPGEIARAKGQALNSYRIGALPIIDRLLQRMRLDEFLRSYLPRADRRCRIAPSIGISLLLKNVLLSREPLYGIGEWAARFAPEILGFVGTQLPSLNDDRVGRCLDRLFQSDITSMVLALTTHVVREFQVDLDELHNDSTMGKTAATLMSLCATCKNLGVDAFAYLRDVLERINTHPARRIGELLPDQWKKERVAADVAPVE